MTTVLMIDDDEISRAGVRAAAPADWLILEAADGLTGIDLVRQHYHALALVVLDIQLPDVDGRTVCLRMREVRPDLPILPFTGHAATGPALQALGCLPAVLKPAHPATLAHALRRALDQPPPKVSASAVVGLALEQSQLIERLVRQQRLTLHVAIYAPSAITRAGLTQLLAPIAQTWEATHLPALELLLSRRRWTAIVADAAGATDVLTLAHAYRVPLVLIAADVAQLRATQTAAVATVLLASDPLLAAHLQAALTALAHGAQPAVLAVPVEAETGHRRMAPPRVVQLFAETAISPRELDVIWLDYQGLTRDQIARTLQITPLTINSHWRNIAGKLGMTRRHAQMWTRERLNAFAMGRDEDT